MGGILDYPFDSGKIKRKKKSIKRQLLEKNGLIKKNIAILGGSTTNEIKDILELFLLNQGIEARFYESEYAQYWQDAMFGNNNLEELKPDIIFIHTSYRNIVNFPDISDSIEAIDNLLDTEYLHFEAMWDKLSETYKCPIIQNNFEYPTYRLLGNKDVSDLHGRVNFISRLNMKFSEYAQTHDNFYINDINYQSSVYGLDKWSDPFYWHMYKYALNLDAVPMLAFNVSNIIKSIYGKNKKAIALDLDNTLWGGVVGDDGVENLVLGNEVSMGQAYTEFQQYLRLLQKQGILLNIISKNEEENAMAGIDHPQMILKKEDFISIKANWEPKSQNLINMAEELTLLPESFVFVDDNPAERAIVEQQVPGTAIAELTSVEHYIQEIDHMGCFEVTKLSSDDFKRNTMYKENVKRAKLQQSFANYNDYLISLNMKAVIRPFESIYMSRIAQLTNKSNQFNLTTKRFTQEEIEKLSKEDNYITLYGKLEDCFGDNGVVALAIAELEGDTANIILWLMSCRVLKRDMECAMMDSLICECKKRNIKTIYGYYYPTAKNKMVKDFYGDRKFLKISEDEDGNSTWLMELDKYKEQNNVIKVEEK